MSRPPPPVPCSPRPHPFSWLSIFSPFSNVKYEVLLRNFPPFLPLSAFIQPPLGPPGPRLDFPAVYSPGCPPLVLLP